MYGRDPLLKAYLHFLSFMQQIHNRTDTEFPSPDTWNHVLFGSIRLLLKLVLRTFLKSFCDGGVGSIFNKNSPKKIFTLWKH